MTPSAPARRSTGFTLVELVIVIAIAGVLAWMALPSFADALRRSRRSEAVAALMQLQQAQERWRGDHSGYAIELTTLGVAERSATGLYTLAIDSADARGYLISATATASQVADARCRVFRLSQSGALTVYASVDAAQAESSGTPNPCWSV